MTEPPTIDPWAYTSPFHPAYKVSVEAYLRAAESEAFHVEGLVVRAMQLAGKEAESWPEGSPARLASMLSSMAVSTRISLPSATPLDLAKRMTVVALLWAELRRRKAKTDAFSKDVQLAATESSEAQAEEYLRALAESGQRPKFVDWRELVAGSPFFLGPRPARRVWGKVVADHPGLSSPAGKPKARRKA